MLWQNTSARSIDHKYQQLEGCKLRTSIGLDERFRVGNYQILIAYQVRKLRSIDFLSFSVKYDPTR